MRPKPQRITARADPFTSLSIKHGIPVALPISAASAMGWVRSGSICCHIPPTGSTLPITPMPTARGLPM